MVEKEAASSALRTTLTLEQHKLFLTYEEARNATANSAFPLAKEVFS